MVVYLTSILKLHQMQINQGVRFKIVFTPILSSGKNDNFYLIVYPNPTSKKNNGININLDFRF